MKEKAYLVGIDFGNGETAAYCTPNPRYWQGKKDCPIEEGHLRILNANEPHTMKVRTIMRLGKDKKYQMFGAGNVIIGLKRKIKKESDSTQEAFKAFIQEIYCRIVDYNDHLKDGNFELCIASPTKWTEEEKEEYIKFFNEALKPYNRKVFWVINESDAAYFTHRDNSNNVLVIDYGSSTIDYTLMSHGKKVSDDSWSNELGARKIEQNMLIAYMKDKMNFDATMQRNEVLLRQTDNNHIDPYTELELACRISKEEGWTGYFPANMHRPFDYNFDCSLSKATGDVDFQSISFKHHGFFRDFNEKEGICENYINEVIDDFRKLKKKIDKALNGERLDRVILSGGACIMQWVKIEANNIFSPLKKIECDNYPEYVVAKGIARYAQAQMEALDDLRKRIADIKYDEIYEPVYVKVCKEKIVDIVTKRSTSIAKIQNPNGEKIRDEYIKLIKAIDNTDVEFCSSVVNALNDTINEKIREGLKSTIQNKFGIVIDVSDVAMNINPLVGRFIDEDFEPNGFFYKIVSDGIKSTIFFSFLFDWDQEKDQNEVREIITSVDQNIANEVLANSLKINIIDLQQRADDIKQQVLEKIDDIFYQNQLFKTTYLRTLN